MRINKLQEFKDYKLQLQMYEGSGNKNNSKISIESGRSRGSGSMSLGRPSFNNRNPSLSKKLSLVYVMSVESDHRSDSIGCMLEENSYPYHNHNVLWQRSSVDNNNLHQFGERRPSNEGRTQGHSCQCYPTCNGQQCPCFSARHEICIKGACCETCIQMKNAMLMADRGQFCNCKQSHCLKSYCKCFQFNGVCTSLCRCEDCKNKIQSKQRAEAIEALKGAPEPEDPNRKFCTCKKTKCNKKYCSCYANGIKCSSQCQCENCINCDMAHQPIEQERPPSFYNEQQLAAMEMPDRMSFQKIEFSHLRE